MTNTETRIIATEVLTARAAVDTAKATGDIERIETACREQVDLLLAVEGEGVYERASEAVKLAHLSGDLKRTKAAEENLAGLISSLGHSSGEYINQLREQGASSRADIERTCGVQPTLAEAIATETQPSPL